MTETDTIRLAALYRYPVKGLSPETLTAVELAPGRGVPGDRAYAIENGPSGFDPETPRFIQKAAFLMLMRNERLAALKTNFDQETRILTISGRDGEALARGNLDSAAGRTTIEAFFGQFSKDELRGPPRVLSAPGHSFADCGEPFVSLINPASLGEVAGLVGTPIHPLRFRGNLYVDGLPAWAEFDLVGKRLRAGDALFEAVRRIRRCAAVNVDPETARRDLQLPRRLLEAYGHAECGIYLRVVKGGTVAVGDSLMPA